MALKLPVLHRTRKKDDTDQWVSKTTTVSGPGSPSRQLPRGRDPRPLEAGARRRRSTVVGVDKGQGVPVPDTAGGGEGDDGDKADKDRISDSEFDDVLEVPNPQEVTSSTARTYRRAARRLGVIPLRKVLTELGKDRVTFRNLTLTTWDMKALCTALLREREIVEMDFSGNYISGRECDYLVSVLSRAEDLETLNLSNNCLSGRAIRCLSAYVCDSHNLTVLDISGNKLIDSDAQTIASFLETNCSLKTLVMNHNEFRETGGRVLGHAIGKNKSLEELELRWNHLRRDGAIGIAKGLEENSSVWRVDLAWNGFGFEGCVALSDALARNRTLRDLDVSSNRINAPALMELIRGLAKNKTLKALRLGQNPITASFTCVILNVIRKHPTMVIDHLDMEGIVVDREFQTILDDLRKVRPLHVTYDVMLPVKALSREDMLRRIQAPGAYGLDPLHMFYLLKEKMRATDFFHKINKDHDDGVTRDELVMLFQEAGIPVTDSVVDTIVEFMDTDGDGTIDLQEFMSGDKKIKRISRQAKATRERERKKKRGSRDEGHTRNSRTFRQADFDPLTPGVKISQPPDRLAPMADPGQGPGPGVKPRDKGDDR